MSGGAWPWAALSRCASVARPRPDTQAHPPTPSLSGPRAFLSRWRERQGASGSDTDETAPPQPRLVPAVAMGDLSVDPVTFWERLSKLHKMWNVRPAARANVKETRAARIMSPTLKSP